MDNFKIIYKILKTIEKSMDFEEFDKECISYERLGISYERWEVIMHQLVVNDYIAGVHLLNNFAGSLTPDIKIIKPYLTIKGMEYLEENSMMKKVANMAKGVIDIIK
ncbi:MAG: YjcQ family protein [Fusobacterium gastrosuis]|uniref:YjcQ family protein n=1 Tax=Fusobacterium gastrosuis TaxID=1755100 RepID=UPI002A9EA0AD|nr:YjcQ family protein [Fusobacterium gastrosuis]